MVERTSVTIPQAFELALQRHQAGRLAEAEALYRQILVAQPNHSDALHLLGVIAQQRGHHDLAAEWIRRAIELDPNHPAAHCNLGEAYRCQGRLEEAVAEFRHALRLKPDYPEAHSNLGNTLRNLGRLGEAIAAYRRAAELNPAFLEAHINSGNTLRDLGRFDEAVAAYRRALELKPAIPEVLNDLGNALTEGRQFDEAIANYRRALELKPDFLGALNNLGNALRERADPEGAIAACRRALELRPDFPEALNNLGNALRDLGRLDEAVAAYHRALELNPRFAAAHINLGNALRELLRPDEAIANYRRALELKPDFPETLGNLGNALSDLGRLDEAIANYRRALELKPGFCEAHNNLGNALRDLGRLDEAIASYRRALELKPDYAEAHNNLGNALRDQGQLDDAAAASRRALELKPDYPEAFNNLGVALAAKGEIEESIAAFRHALRLKPEHAATRSNLIYTLLFLPGDHRASISEECRRWNQLFGEPQRQIVRPQANARSSERRLRIGYVSPDFRDHVVGRNLMPLFRRHDRRNFEIACYSGVVRPDDLTNEFRQRADIWRSTVGVGDDALAEMIRRDGVDILVDLAQHLAGNRLPVFTRTPAPVQVSFAGYPESAGVDAIERRISDRYLEADSAGEGIGGEERMSLIDSFWCYDPCGFEVEVNELPAAATGKVTFGCLNNFCKVNEPLLKLWARVLRKVTDSRLILLSKIGSHRRRTEEAFLKEGIEIHRVEFVDFRPRREYLELYHRLDIVLDTFPYNGHTTSLDALWMGVPVVSLAGNTPVSRAGLSQLTNLGLPELAAHSESEYVNIAESLARDLPRLVELRSTLRGRMEHSVLMDAPHFARSIEAAYREMWQTSLQSDRSAESSTRSSGL